MTKTLDIQLRYRPTQQQLDAIASLHKFQQGTETYTGEWTTSDTVRGVLNLPFISNNYPTKTKRVSSSKTVNASKAFVEGLSPAYAKESKCAHLYRLLSSGLVQMGYLEVDESEPVAPL